MFAIQTHGMHAIRSYEDAKHHFESTEQPRGKYWTEDMRPLDDVRKPHMCLVRGGNHGDEFACRLYQTNMITYCPDGSIDVKFDARKSSICFMDCVTPYGLDYRSRHGLAWVRAGDQFYTSGTVLSFEREDGLGNWKLMNPEDLYIPDVPRVDRKLAAEVRKNLASFEQWQHAMKRLGTLRSSYLSHWEAERAIRTLLERPDDVSIYPLIGGALSTEAIRIRAYEASGAYMRVPSTPGVLPAKVA